MWVYVTTPGIIAVHGVHSRVRLLMIPLPPVAHLTPSNTMKSNQERGSLLVSTNLISSDSVKVYVASSAIESYHWSSGGQPKAMTKYVLAMPTYFLNITLFRAQVTNEVFVRSQGTLIFSFKLHEKPVLWSVQNWILNNYIWNIDYS